MDWLGYSQKEKAYIQSEQEEEHSHSTTGDDNIRERK